MQHGLTPCAILRTLPETEGSEMAEDPGNFDIEEQIKALQDLRAYVVETRRSSAIQVGGKDDRIQSIIDCQEAIRAIDEAIADELGSRPTGYNLDSIS